MKKNDRDRRVPLLTKTIRIMKVTSLCNLLAVCSISASTYAQSLKFSIHKQNSSISEVFKEIEKKSDFTFFFNDNQINVKQKVNVSANNASIEDVLAQVLQNTGYNYQIIDKQILIKVSDKEVMAVPAVAQSSKKITGTVLDATGMPVIGANVMIKGTTNGTITDMDGKFSLDVEKGAVLVVSYIGFTSQEIKVGNQTKLSIELKEDSQALDELVVVGYGTMKKADLTGSVATVDSEVLEDRPITNLGSGLQGAIANLNISSSNGAPGTGASFNIRGTTNLSGSGPLVLVDGVEMDPNLINPQDVKDVTVLKDAASASIYGARAAFGVVLITTKTGFTNMKPQVSLTANYSINVPTVHADYMNSMQYTQWMNDANMTSNGSNYFDEITMQHVRDYYNDPVNNQTVFHHPDDSPSKYRYCGNTDWYEALNKKSYPMQQYNISVQGGSESAKYNTSAGMFQQDGISKWTDEDYKRFNVL